MSTIQVTNINDLSDNASLVTQNGGIKTDKLTGNTTAGSISVVGEGNSTTTNLQQGLAKAFNAFDFNDNSTKDSLNIGSVTDRGTGSLYGNYTNNMNSVSHIAIGSVSSAAQGSMSTANNNRICIISSDTAARYSQNCTENNGTFNNVRYAAASIHGDLA